MVNTINVPYPISSRMNRASATEMVNSILIPGRVLTKHYKIANSQSCLTFYNWRNRVKLSPCVVGRWHLDSTTEKSLLCLLIKAIWWINCHYNTYTVYGSLKLVDDFVVNNGVGHRIQEKKCHFYDDIYRIIVFKSHPSHVVISGVMIWNKQPIYKGRSRKSFGKLGIWPTPVRGCVKHNCNYNSVHHM